MLCICTNSSTGGGASRDAKQMKLFNGVDLFFSSPEDLGTFKSSDGPTASHKTINNGNTDTCSFSLLESELHWSLEDSEKWSK